MTKPVILTALCISIIGCNQNAPTENEKEFAGNHVLRQLATASSPVTSASGSYFLIAGGFSAESSIKTKVTFAWQGNDGIYRFMTLPLDKIRIELAPQADVPVVRFKWSEYADGDRAVTYAVISTNPKEWPVDWKIPTAQEVK